METYHENVEPKFVARFLDHPVATWSLSIGISALFTFGLVFFLSGTRYFVNPANLSTEVIPDIYFKGLSALLYSFILIVWTVEGIRYWQTIKKDGRRITLRYFILGLKDALQHKYFGGGGAGCNYPGERGTVTRLLFHGMLVTGFLLDLGTILFYPNMGKILVWAYIIGAAGMFIGSSFLLALKPLSNQSLLASGMRDNDYPFTVAMMITGLTGIIFPIASGTYLYTYFFLIHVALVAGIFLMAPYSKFLHPVFRIVSLAANRSEADKSASGPL
ncbi:MAG: hypothetical protein M1431_07815 [Candidatus Thermoplasmatota archaeon]|nr:hypothetical protein [Candidatus Thermoplasmatota archaeon]